MDTSVPIKGHFYLMSFNFDNVVTEINHAWTTEGTAEPLRKITIILQKKAYMLSMKSLSFFFKFK